MQEELDLLHDIGEEDAAACMTNPFHSHCLDESRLSFAELEVKGRKGVAKRHVSSIKFIPNEKFLSNEDEEIALVREEASKRKSTQQSCPTLKTLMHVAAQRKVQRVKINEKDINILAANGTAGSVIDWAKKYKLDIKQRQAFYTMTSSFVLTCANEALEQYLEDEFAHFQESMFMPSRKKTQEHVQLLKDLNGQKELRLFLSGAGGTGKSNVIDHVVSYCKAFCESIHAPFTDRTVVVTALTGVAAVLINGETLHSASHTFANT